MQVCGSRLLGLRSPAHFLRASKPRGRAADHLFISSTPRTGNQPVTFVQARRFIRNDPRQDGYSREPEARPSSTEDQAINEELQAARPRLSVGENKFADEGWYVPPTRASLLRALAWTCGIGFLSFTGASYLTNRETEELATRVKARSPTPADLAKAKMEKEMHSALRTIAILQERLPFFVVSIYARVKEWLLNMDEGRRVGAGITAVNAIVFLAWQIPHPAMRAFMTRHFTHHPLSGKYYTMLTSCFSHAALWHFALNMYAMQNFLSATDHYISSVQAQDPDCPADDPSRRHRAVVNSGYKTLAFFVTAGVVSSFGLHAAVTMNLLRKMRTMPFEAALAHSRLIKPSLGASGAIYGTVTCTALAWPESSVNLFFAIPVPITYGTLGLVSLDIMGLIRGWQMFAHEAHLAGAAFGAAYYGIAPYVNAAIAKTRNAHLER